MITRSQIKYEILTRLNKSAANPGFYTDAKMDSVIQEAVDFLTAESMLADEGFTHKLEQLTTTSGMVSLAIPFDMAMLLEVSYLVGDIYAPMTYDQQWGQAQWASSSGAVQQYPARYKLVDNMLYFNPPLGQGGQNYLQIEFMAYPRRMMKDSDVLPGQFDRCMFYYIIYRACNLLAGQVQQTVDDWQQNEALWYAKALQMINLRTRQVIPVRAFEGY